MKLRHSDMPIEYICRLLGKTEQTYYYHVRYQAQLINNESIIITKVVSLREEMPGIGVSKLLHILTGYEDYKKVCPGRDKLYDLLRRHSLLLIRRVKRGPTTTNSRHRYMLYPNLIRELYKSESLGQGNNIPIYLCWVLLPELNYRCLLTPDCRISCSS